jgi:predicted RNase H-like HicB family nuclease
MRCQIVIEKAERDASVCVPELPGCTSTGRTFAEVTRNMDEAIDFHLEGMREDGGPIPGPTAQLSHPSARVKR